MNKDLDHPQHIARYEVREVLGTGAMGSVYGAWDPKMQRLVAIKVVPERLRRQGKGRERFEREARALAAIAHPNIVEIYDYSGLEAATPFVVIERLEGEDLYAALYRRGKMPEAIAAAIGHDLCLALEAAHGAGLIHRDLKPENVFLHRGGRVVLTDFGIVKAVRAATTVRGYSEKTEVIGTPGFMAPEQMRGRTLGPSLDLYSLGALLYNIVTQHMPFEGNSALAIFHAAQKGEFEDPRTFNAGLSEAFCAIIRSLLQPLPGRRPASARDVRLALRQVLDAAGVTEVRDDVAAYMADPEAARRHLLRRAIGVQARRLQLAHLERDPIALGVAHAHLRSLDPAHAALAAPAARHSNVFGLGIHRRHLRYVAATLQARSLAFGRRGLANLTFSDSPSGLPKWVFAACLTLVFGALALGLTVRPTAQTRTAQNVGRIAARPTPATALASRESRHLPVLADNPSGLPALLRAPHPTLPGPLRQAPTAQQAAVQPAVAWMDIRLDEAVHPMLDGRRLTQRAYTHLPLLPGRHTVDYVSAQGRHVRRVLILAAGQRLRLRVDAHRRATARP